MRFLLSGARVVELASIAISNAPGIFSEILADLTGYCERKRISRLDELLGKAADSARTYAEIPVSQKKPYPWNFLNSA